MLIRAFEAADAAAVIELWRVCGLVRPWNDPATDIERKVADSGELFLVAASGEGVAGCVMAGYDGHRGWLNYLAVDPAQQRSGLGRRLVEAAEDRLRALGCAKVNLQIRDDNAVARGFYEALGYREDPVVSYGKRLVEDR